MNYPNKTFIVEVMSEHELIDIHRFIVVAARDAETAAQHLKTTIGFKGNSNDLTWLMNTDHVRLYDQRGTFPLDPQAKILYNSAHHRVKK